ncbi:sugar transferase [Nocardioides thalensis]|nr:sugar transferase [Nocardioides thalensis]
MMERTRQLVGAEPSRTLRYVPVAVLAVDLAMMVVVGALALYGREQLRFLNPVDGVRESLGVAGPLIVAGWIAMVALVGGYRHDAFGSGTAEYRSVVNASFLTAGLVGIGCYLAKFELSRGWFLLAFAIGLPGLIASRWLARRLLRSARRHGFLQVRVLVSGTPDHIDEVTDVLRREAWLGYRIVGAVTRERDLVEETATGVPVLGLATDVTMVAEDAHADVIVFASGGLDSAKEMREKVWELEERGIKVVVAPSLDDISSDRITVRPVGGLPLIHVDSPRWSDAASFGKRLFDVVGSAMLILALGPVFLFATAQIWLHDRGPILFRQKRAGRHGEMFECLKFRTMVPDADRLIAELLADQDHDGLLFKMKDDPRITRPGRWLRRFSVDELPQLFNVLRGDMSLVGPRPQVQREVDLYHGGMSRRLLVRPGMTGLWQVSGRNDLSAEEAMRLDLFYVDNWSMLQDVAILVRTAGAVVSSRGAY